MVSVPPRGLSFGRYRGDLQSQRQLGRAQIREQVRRGCGPTCALHDLDRIPQGTVKDPLLKEQEMIMGDANPP